MNVALITGSRHWRDAKPIFDVVKSYDAIVVGCAKGADRIARLCAFVLHKRRQIFKADWRAHGRRAGSLRNYDMRACCMWLQRRGHAVKCHAFPLLNSVGTRHCIKIFRRKGFDVVIHERRDACTTEP